MKLIKELLYESINGEWVQARDIKKNDCILINKRKYKVYSINREGGGLSFWMRTWNPRTAEGEKFTNKMFPGDRIFRCTDERIPTNEALPGAYFAPSITRPKKKKKVVKKTTTAMSASSLRKTIVDAFKQQGFKLDSQEQTPGTLKAWMDAPSGHSKGPLEDSEFEMYVNKISKQLPDLKLKYYKPVYSHDLPEARGKGFEITPLNGIVIVVYRKGTAGKEYEMGMDT